MGPSRALALVAAAACLAPSVSKTRPNLGKGPVVIACLPSINHVFALNEAEQEMHVSVNLDCYWNDTRLGGTDRTRMDPGEIWLPDLEALSQIEPPQEVRVESAFVDHGRVHFRTRKNLKVYQKFDLRKYPFDRHTIPIVFSDVAYGAADMTLVLAGPAAVSNDTELRMLDSPQFRMDWVSMSAGTAASSVTDKDAVLVLEMHLHRQPWNTIFNTVIPLCIITVSAIATLFIKVELFEARMTAVSTALLTVMAAAWLVNDSLPKIAYLTWLHWYTFYTLALVFCTFMLTIFIHWLDPDLTSFVAHDKWRIASKIIREKIEAGEIIDMDAVDANGKRLSFHDTHVTGKDSNGSDARTTPAPASKGGGSGGDGGYGTLSGRVTEDKINSYIEQERRQLLEEHVDSHSVKSHCCGLMTTDNAYVLDYWVRHLLMPVFIVMNLGFFVYAQMEVASLHEWIQLLRTQAGQQ